MRYYKAPPGANFWFPEDQSGYFCTSFKEDDLYYRKDGRLHREDGPAIVDPKFINQYYLNGKFYGDENDYTDESWIRFCKLKMFL